MATKKKRYRSSKPQFDWRRFHDELREKIARRDFRPWLARQEIVFRGTGNEARARCPIHGGEDFNFSVREQESGFSWRCYSECGDGGDLVALLYAMEREGSDYQSILKLACEIVGLDYDHERELAGHHTGSDPHAHIPRSVRVHIKRATPTPLPERHERHEELLKQLLAALSLDREGFDYLEGRSIRARFKNGVRTRTLENMCHIKSATPAQWRDAILSIDHKEERATLEALGVSKKGSFFPSERWSKHWLVLPYFDGETLDAIRLRAMDRSTSPKMLSLRGSQNTPSIPYLPFPQLANRAGGHLFITEGELDALSIVDAGHFAIGVPGANGWRKGWMAWLAERMELKRVVLLTDRDQAGEQLIKDIRADITTWRPSIARKVDIYRGILECKDANEALQRHGRKMLGEELARMSQGG